MLQTASGDLVIEGANGRLSAQTASGDVRVTSARIEDFQIQTANGDILVDALLTAAGVPHGRLDADHGDDEDRQVELVPASIAKGLEFDRVVVVEPAAVVDAEPDLRTGLRRLYVVLTRAVSELTVVHAEPLPGPLTSG